MPPCIIKFTSYYKSLLPECKSVNCKIVLLHLIKSMLFGQDKDSETYLIKLTLHFHNGSRVIHVLLTFTSPSRHFENGDLGCGWSFQDSDAGRDWGQEEKGTTEDEMVGWHH